jgi:hypothetical protein
LDDNQEVVTLRKEMACLLGMYAMRVKLREIAA